jgi:hypothetical protein
MRDSDTFILTLETAMPLIRQRLTAEEWVAFSAGLRALAPEAARPDADLEALVERIRDVARPYDYVREMVGERGAPMIPTEPPPSPQRMSEAQDVRQVLFDLLHDPEGVARRQGWQGEAVGERRKAVGGQTPDRRDA